MDELDEDLFNFAAGSRGRKRGRKAASSEEESEELMEAPRRKAKPARTNRRDDDSDLDLDEGLFQDEEDRRKLLAMTELDREMILAERAEQRDKERQRRELLQQQRASSQKVLMGLCACTHEPAQGACTARYMGPSLCRFHALPFASGPGLA
jgi:RNA polymerase-associated protein RTF1